MPKCMSKWYGIIRKYGIIRSKLYNTYESNRVRVREKEKRNTADWKQIGRRMHFLSIIEWWLSEWDEYHSNIVHYHHHHCRQQTTCDSFQYVQCSNVWSHPVLSACIYVLQSVRACVNMYGLIILSLNRCAHGVGALMDRDTPIRQPNINI